MQREKITAPKLSFSPIMLICKAVFRIGCAVKQKIPNNILGESAKTNTLSGVFYTSNIRV
jgi:hypothetical protein